MTIRSILTSHVRLPYLEVGFVGLAPYLLPNKTFINTARDTHVRMEHFTVNTRYIVDEKHVIESCHVGGRVVVPGGPKKSIR